MKSLGFLAGAFALAGFLSFVPGAGATPLFAGGAPFAPPPGNGLLHKVSGCHPQPQYHHVYQWGYQVWHYHGGAGCNPVPASPPGYYPQPQPQPYPPGFVAPQVCHRNWQNHYHPGSGGGWHKHAGPNCYPVRGRQWKGGSRKNCAYVFGVWICG